MPTIESRSHVFPIARVLRRASALVALLVLATVVTSCGGGGAGLVIPPLVTGQSVILVDIRADSTLTTLPGATLNVAGPGSPQVSSIEPGKFKVIVAPGATYQLLAAAAGYAAQIRTVAVQSRTGLASSVTQVTIPLAPAPPSLLLTPAGGVLDAGNGISVNVPAGAVATAVPVTLTVKSMTASGGGAAAGPEVRAAVLGGVDLFPAGRSFSAVVEIIVPRAFLKIADALVAAGSTFELWEAGAAAGGFVLSSGTAVYRAATDDFLMGLPHTGAFQLRPGVTVEVVGELTRDLGTLTSTVGGSILEGTTTFDYSTSSSATDPALNGLLTATFGTEPDVDLSAPNPAVEGTEGFITELNAKQTGERVTIRRGGALVGTADYYGAQVVVMGILRPPPRTGTG